MKNIKELIPQREPFLFVENIKDFCETTIETEFTFSETLDFFKGHFPDNPIVPGVILNEHCFQSAAAFMALSSKQSLVNSLTVVSRIQSAKFKNIVRAGEKITSHTQLEDKLENAAFFKSKIMNDKNQKVLLIEFSVALVEEKHA